MYTFISAILCCVFAVCAVDVCLLRTVPPLAPRHALTREVWRALLSHHRELMGWEATPGT